MKSQEKSLSRLTLMCIFVALFSPMLTLYFYIHNQNQLTELRREIPLLQSRVKKIQEENRSLQYERDRFESPLHLMELARKPEYGHLKYPSLNEVIIFRDKAGALHEGEGHAR